MKDKEFLKWIHSRLISEYEVNANFDYMRKLRAVIAATDPDICTPNIASCSDEMRKDDKEIIWTTN